MVVDEELTHKTNITQTPVNSKLCSTLVYRLPSTRKLFPKHKHIFVLYFVPLVCVQVTIVLKQKLEDIGVDVRVETFEEGQGIAALGEDPFVSCSKVVHSELHQCFVFIHTHTQNTNCYWYESMATDYSSHLDNHIYCAQAQPGVVWEQHMLSILLCS